MKASARNWFIAWLVIVTLLGTLAPRVAFSARQDVDSPIHLKAASFTPARGEAPNIPDALKVKEYAAHQRGYYLVQFRGPIEQAWKDELAGLGVELLDYVPDLAFKVRMAPAQAAQVRQLPSVAWVDFFHPAYKLNPELKRPESGPGLYRVQIERGAEAGAVLETIAGSGAQVLGSDGAALLVAADAAQLEALARVLDVAWIDNMVLREKHNEYGGGTLMGANTANASGYDGSTQIVAVADTGLGGGTAATAHADIPSSRIVAIYNWPGVSDSCWTITDDGAVDVDSGHGTHTTLSVVSDGGASGEGKGVAPAAQLVFQATENWATMKGLCALYYPNGYYLTGLPSTLGTLFQQAYDAGARIHSNSWGAAEAGAYTDDSVQTDTFVWSHKDMLITFSAGNEGIDSNSDGVIDNGSMGAPATAKNVLTVGASENDRQGHWECDAGLTYATCTGQNSIPTWGASWPSDYPANPIKNDPQAGNAQQMAAFSSRGPVDDGRIKPDVVAPGSWVLSGYSDLYQQGYDASPNPKNNAWQYDGYGMPRNASYKYMSGTSMSNPLAAGAATVVRDYYKKAYGIDASAALVKATLINSAVDLLDENNDGANDNDYPIPNNHEGWGLINLANATDGSAQYVENTGGLSTNGSATYQFGVSSSGAPLKITSVWSDYPSTTSASKNLVNDLDLEVSSPSGTLYKGNVFSGGWSQAGGSADRINNVENVYIQSAEAGTWTVVIKGYNIPNGPQPFALVVDGNLGAPPPTPTPTPITPTPTPTPTPLPTSTGLKSPASNVAYSTGDKNGFEVNPTNAYADDTALAVDNNSGTGTSTSCTNNKKDSHGFYNYSFNLPAGAAIKGIEVRLDAQVDSTSNTPKMCVMLSWDGGNTWTAAKSTATLSTSEQTYILGGPTDTWGHAWTDAQLANSAFRVRIVNVASSTARDFSLDWLAVNVHYQ